MDQIYQWVLSSVEKDVKAVPTSLFDKARSLGVNFLALLFLFKEGATQLTLGEIDPTLSDR